MSQYIDENFDEVSEDRFKNVTRKFKLNVHTVMICEPAVTLFSPEKCTMEKSLALIVHDSEPGNPLESCPKYYIRKNCNE